LKILTFKKERHADAIAESSGGDGRRGMDASGDTLAGGVDV
jgi:hypothetical protein